MIEIKFDDRKVQRALKKVQRELRNPKKLLNMVGEREIKKAEERIRSSKVDPQGIQWKPWAYATLIQRAREGNVSQGILYRTGNLLRSFYYRATRNTVEISNRAKYAKYLQLGTNQMPKREFMGWGKDSFKTLPVAFKRMILKVWK